MMQYLKQNWGWSRSIRTILGLAFVAEGIHASQWAVMLIGVVLLIQGVFQIGHACSQNSCTIETKSNHTYENN